MTATTKAQLAAQLIELQNEIAELKAKKPTFEPMKPGRLRIIRDFSVPLDSGKGHPTSTKNPFYGYVSIPEGVTGEVRFACWCSKDADFNVISGRLHGELDTDDGHELDGIG